MTIETALFTILATTMVVSAIGVVVTSQIMRSAIWLLITLISVAFLYFLLGAEFLGTAQLIIYVGGTLVLLVFGGMLTGGGPFQSLPNKKLEWVIGGIVALGIFGVLTYVSLQLGTKSDYEATSKLLPGTGEIGLSFLGITEVPNRGSAFLLPFEVVSIHLLVVLIGAAYMARAKRRVVTPS